MAVARNLSGRHIHGRDRLGNDDLVALGGLDKVDILQGMP